MAELGDDWIAGGASQVMPDRYEFAAGASNNNVAHASLIQEDLSPLRRRDAITGELLPAVQRDVVIRDLNLSYGDTGDWYILKTPEAIKKFGAVKAAQLVKEAIQIEFEDPEARINNSPISERLALFDYIPNERAGRLLYLYAGIDTNAGEALSVVPVQDFEGVPTHYLIQVVNPNNFAVIVLPRYRIPILPAAESPLMQTSA